MKKKSSNAECFDFDRKINLKSIWFAWNWRKRIKTKQKTVRLPSDSKVTFNLPVLFTFSFVSYNSMDCPTLNDPFDLSLSLSLFDESIKSAKPILFCSNSNKMNRFPTLNQAQKSNSLINKHSSFFPLLLSCKSCSTCSK